MSVVMPMKRTIGRITSANSVNPSPNSDACATRARATIAPVSVDRNIPARLNDSFQASERDASRLQCSVERIWSRIAGETSSFVTGSPMRGAGAGSAPIPAWRSKDIIRTSLSRRPSIGSATVSDRQEYVALGGQVIDLPSVEAALRVRLRAHDLGVRSYGAYVALRVVVAEERVRHVARRAVRLQITRRRADRIAVGVHVTLAVRGPRARHELHRALSARDGRAADATHARLDEMDGCQVRPRHPELGLRVAVEARQVVERRGIDDAPRGRQVRSGNDRRTQVRGRIEIRGDDAADRDR